eukprot:8984422-Pyramimonas_sp.AAC.1
MKTGPMARQASMVVRGRKLELLAEWFSIAEGTATVVQEGNVQCRTARSPAVVTMKLPPAATARTASSPGQRLSSARRADSLSRLPRGGDGSL